MNMARLLVVENDESDLEILRRKLSDAFDLRLARTLAEAKHVIEREPLDAVLLDLGLPDSEKEKTMRACKQICPPIAIVVLSGYSDPELISKTISENASDFLVKGIGDRTGEGLASSIRTAIKSNEAICTLKDMKKTA